MKKKTVNPAVKFLQENLVSIGIILLMVVTAVINPTFISASNLTNVLRQLGALPFVALGMTLSSSAASSTSPFPVSSR